MKTASNPFARDGQSDSWKQRRLTTSAQTEEASTVPAPDAKGAPRNAHHLNQTELSRRWRLSPRTLERWRWQQQGPAFLKIGGRVVYRLEDIEAFESLQRRR
jgi:hypothetical protein